MNPDLAPAIVLDFAKELAKNLGEESLTPGFEDRIKRQATRLLLRALGHLHPSYEEILSALFDLQYCGNGWLDKWQESLDRIDDATAKLKEEYS